MNQLFLTANPILEAELMAEANGVTARNAVSPSSDAVDRAVLLALLASCACWLIGFALVGYPWSMIGLSMTDSLVYFWMAQALHLGSGDPTAAHGWSILSETRFPPGYPAFLSMFGPNTDASGLRAANIGQFVSVLLALLSMVALYWRYLKPPLAMAACAYSLTLPWLYPWSFDLISEPLFVALLLLACRLADPLALRRWSFVWIALLFGLLCLTRSLGYPLLVALAWWMWTRVPSRRHWLLGMSIAIAPLVLWKLYQGMHGSAADSYLGWTWQQFAQLPPGVLKLAWTQWAHLASSLTPAALPDLLRAGIGSVLLLAALAQALGASLRAELMGAVTLILFCVLVAWPFPLHFDRLVAPLAPLVVLYALLPWAKSQQPAAPEPALESQRPYPPRWAARLLALLALALVWACAILPMLDGGHRRVPESQRPYLRSAIASQRGAATAPQAVDHLARVLQVAGELDRLVPATDCVLATWPNLLKLRSARVILDSPVPFAWTSKACSYALAIDVWDGSHAGGANYPMTVNGLRYQPVAEWRSSANADPFARLIRVVE